MNAVAQIEPAPQATEGATLLSVISRAASDPNVNIDKMERLMAMHRDMQRQQAEADFNAAMARVQSSMGRIGTDKRNSQTNSDYATYAKLDRELRPLYSAEGFALSFGTDPAEVENIVRVTCHVSHAAGFTRKYLIDMPADGKGARGNDVMTKTHATGSATQYGMRYLLKMIFNVAIGEDDDGNAASGEDQAAIVRGEWLAAIDACKTPDELKARKKELTAAYGGVDKVPQTLKTACASKSKALEGAQ